MVLRRALAGVRSQIAAHGPRLHMGWRHALFANWPVDPAVVSARLPDGLAIDTFEGQAWLSVVPYTNVDVRPTWAPAGWGVALPELNLRTYVTHETGPGVYFFSLDADGIVSVLGARAVQYLPYLSASIQIDISGDRVAFASRRRHPGARSARFRGTYRRTGDPLAVTPGSRAAFLLERYRLYTATPSGAIRSTPVDHDPWPLYRAQVEISENTLFAANGFDRPTAEPVYYYSPGVETITGRSRPA